MGQPQNSSGQSCTRFKGIGKPAIKANREIVKQWLTEVLHHMDLVDLMCKDQRQMKAPKPKTIVNNLQEI